MMKNLNVNENYKKRDFLFYLADWHFFINVLYFYTPTSTVIQIGFFKFSLQFIA